MQKMLLKIALKVLIVAVAANCVAAAGRYPSYCSECEEEVWEEVPCDEISTSTTTTTTTTSRPTYAPTTPRPPRPTRPTRPPVRPTLPPLPTSTPGYSSYNTTSRPDLNPTTPSEPYNKCYCECKVGCKTFCRKVVVNNDPNQEITQITKTSHNGAQGQLEWKHTHHRKFVPGPYKAPLSYGGQQLLPSLGYTYPVENCEQGDRSCETFKSPNEVIQPPQPPTEVPLPAYVPLPPPPSSSIYGDSKGTTYYPEAVIDSSYSIDELTKLLQAEGLGKPPLPYPSRPLYYPQAPSSNFAYASAPGPSPAPGPSAGPRSIPSYSTASSYAPFNYNYGGSVLNPRSPRPALAKTYSHADHSNSNYIGKDDNAPNVYDVTTPAPGSDQLGSSSVNNNNPAYNIGHGIEYPYAAQMHNHQPYQHQPSYAISYS